MDANTGLAQLLALCGRKREVTPLVLRLIRQDVETDMLLLLVRSDMAVDDPELLTQSQSADPSDPNPHIGLAWHALDKEQFVDAEKLLKKALRLDADNIPARILLGRLLLKTNRSADFASWQKSLPSVADDVAELWLIRGQMAEAIGDRSGAIRCFGETVRLGPESKTATLRLSHCLAIEGDSRAAEALRDRIQSLHALEELQNQVLFADRGRPEMFWPLAQAYESAGRLWEAYGWCQFAIRIGENTPELIAHTERLRHRLHKEPLQLVTNFANVARTIDISQYPLPDLRMKSPAASREMAVSDTTPAFRDDSRTTGLRFQYFNGVSGPTTHRMFEFTGGGVGVLDFDFDAYPDLFFTQGCTWPPGSPDASSGDRLFRNSGGTAFDDITAHAGLQETGFGQGVAIGDYDADGFPDIYVANIGPNQLWQNQGDGTFRNITPSAGLIAHDWTTSTLMADLTGDGLPDIYDVNYAADEDAFDRVCRHSDGSPQACRPADFHGQADRLWQNLGDGRFREGATEVLGETPLGMGLGVAAWDADGAGRLSLFVANDSTPSFFFRPERSGENIGRMRECGIEAGLAFNGNGKATGCMGVAVGDIDDDGRMDLLITNFYAEPNTLFVNSTPGFFEDQTRRLGLEDPSLNMLGFGTQFLDADLDGRLELFVANGHVDDLRRFNRPYRMPPQLFRLDGQGRFFELPHKSLGGYFEQDWLGRAVARLDWNRDGRDDLIVGHLEDQSALLTNVTPDAGQFLSMKLFGTRSNRDAIGTIVWARIGERTLVRQLTAGDGYQASNERRIIIGTGGVTSIDELVVRWPSGLVQRFEDVITSQEVCLREGRS
ncbi:MAG: FG-GAP-like repeat-containing protein, partial [Planctomycetota bacterium]